MSISSSSSSSSSDDDNQAVLQTVQSSVIVTELMSSDDSDDSGTRAKWGGSSPGRSRNVKRDFAGAEAMLLGYYFSGEESLYNEETFENRFRSP